MDVGKDFLYYMYVIMERSFVNWVTGAEITIT